MQTSCDLCQNPGGELLWQDAFCRVVLVHDDDYPGFCRVILNQHIKEMTDLSIKQREYLMTIVFSVEEAIREVMNPDKINIASLGNMTPHIHWHVIPRFKLDRHFPNPIWGQTVREVPPQNIDANVAARLKTEIQRKLG